jgi:dipeptidyl aminopeptidase/acylaminoacyl peptidase
MPSRPFTRRRPRSLALALVSSLAAMPLAAQQAAERTPPPAPPAPAVPAVPLASAARRTLGLEDLLSWKSIRFPTFSNDGRWMAYVLAPNEGDAEFIVRGTMDGAKETRVPIGEAPSGFGGSAGVAISGNNRWVAYTVYPGAEDAKKARRDRRTLATKVAVIELATGAAREFDRVRGFRFAGDRSDVIALQHMPPEAPSGGAGATGGAGGGGSSGSTGSSGSSGSLVTLVDLAGGTPVTIAGVGDYAFDAAGRYLAYTIDQRDRMGNGVQLRDLSTGVVRALDADKAMYRRLAWADTGDALAVLRLTPDTATRDTLATVLGWSRLASNAPVGVRIDEKSAGITGGLVVSGDRAPAWNDEQTALYFGLRAPRTPAPRSEAAAVGGSGNAPAPGAGAGGQVAPARQDEETPSLILWHWKDPRLQSQQQVQESADKSFNYMAVWHLPPASARGSSAALRQGGRVVQLTDDDVRAVSIGRGDRWALGADFTPYQRQANIDGRQLRDVYAVDVRTGERALVAKGVQNPGGQFGSLISPDGARAVWYDDGHWNAYDFATKSSRRITDGVATAFWDEEDDHNVVKPPSGPPFGWSRDSRHVFLRDDWDIWRVPATAVAGPVVNVTGNGRTDRIRYQQRVGANARERGIDVAKPVLVEAYGDRSKKEGLAQVDVQRGGARMLSWEDAKVDYRKARDAEIWAFTRQTFTTFPDWHVAEARLANPRRLTDANPQQREIAWSAGARLVQYKCDNDGPEMQGALFLPAGHEEGKSYPTLTYIYERLSQNFHVYPQPNATRYANPAVYTARGYAYFMPDIAYKLDDPGMSAVWCVVPAVKAAIATGIVDSANVGLQGHSWGGYQTSFITTQTKIFKTGIAGAPLTDMVSMFSSVYWNSGSANQPIFISSQGRFRSGYAQNPDAYLRNSPNRFAQNVEVPLMILHNDRDGAVDFNQGITYYNTLRELGKEVVLLEYVGENHGLARPANQKDYAVRMMEWFDHFLRGQPAPEWLQEGVPRLKMEQHLRERKPLVDPKAKKVEKKIAM